MATIKKLSVPELSKNVEQQNFPIWSENMCMCGFKKNTFSIISQIQMSYSMTEIYQ